MTKKKLIHFEENKTFSHLYQLSFKELKDGFPLKGKWRTEYFKNDHPITLELGCGKGEYTTGLACQFPERNFIGIDVKGARLWRGCKTVQEAGLTNVAFIRTRVDFVEYIFTEGEIDEIWITFPDPQLGRGNEQKRLTSPRFLDRYSRILKNRGKIHLKTDDEALFEYSRETIRQQKLTLLAETYDLYQSPNLQSIPNFTTFYEESHLKDGKTIKYLSFELTKNN